MQKSYYAIITAEVRYDRDIPDGSKLLYAEITALCNERGYCWASNSYFAELYGKSADTISRWISILEKKDYIKSEIDKTSGNQRKIFLYFKAPIGITEDTPIGKNADTLSAKMPIPIGKNAEHNNILNNKKNNIINIAIFDFWNGKKITEHKKMTDDIERAISRVLKEYSQEDIERAISNYSSIFHSRSTYFKHKWTLLEFLSRKNGLPVFLYKSIDDYKIYTEKEQKKEVSQKIQEQKRVDSIVAEHVKNENNEKKEEENRKQKKEEALRWYYSIDPESRLAIEISKNINKNPLIQRLIDPEVPENETQSQKEMREQKILWNNKIRREIEGNVALLYFENSIL